MSAKMITVGFFPYGKEQENPYQNLLIEGLESNGVKVLKIPGRKILPLLQLRNSKADVIHLFWPHDLYLGKNIITRLIKQLTLRCTLPILSKIPVAYSAENIASHHSGTGYNESELKWIARILKRSSGVIYMNLAAPALLKQYYPELPKKQIVIPHVNYLSMYPNTISRHDARAALTLDPRAHVFLIAGRIQPYKGIEDAIDAIKNEHNEPNVLLIAGKCSNEVYVKSLMERIGNDPRIKLVNQFIPNTDLQKYFNAADAVILNYRDVPLNPGSVIMAKGFGARMIVPDVPTLHALDQGDMIFMSEDTVTGIQKAMRMAGPMTKDDTGKIAAQRLAHHDPKLVGAQLKSFYEALLA